MGRGVFVLLKERPSNLDPHRGSVPFRVAKKMFGGVLCKSVSRERELYVSIGSKMVCRMEHR